MKLKPLCCTLAHSTRRIPKKSKKTRIIKDKEKPPKKGGGDARTPPQRWDKKETQKKRRKTTDLKKKSGGDARTPPKDGGPGLGHPGQHPSLRGIGGLIVLANRYRPGQRFAAWGISSLGGGLVTSVPSPGYTPVTERGDPPSKDRESRRGKTVGASRPLSMRTLSDHTNNYRARY